jgi:predicted DNA-binding transcriptional regulator YafY
MEDLLAQLQPGLIRQHLAPLRTRLETMLASGGAKKNEIRSRIRILRMPARSVEPKHFQILCSAALSRKRLQLVYYNHSNGEETQRIVSPQRLIYYKANWYLYAWCHLRKALRSFAVDAIRAATILPDKTRDVSNAVLDVHWRVQAWSHDQMGTQHRPAGTVLSGPLRHNVFLLVVVDRRNEKWLRRPLTKLEELSQYDWSLQGGRASSGERSLL